MEYSTIKLQNSVSVCYKYAIEITCNGIFLFLPYCSCIGLICCLTNLKTYPQYTEYILYATNWCQTLQAAVNCGSMLTAATALCLLPGSASSLVMWTGDLAALVRRIILLYPWHCGISSLLACLCASHKTICRLLRSE